MQCLKSRRSCASSTRALRMCSPQGHERRGKGAKNAHAGDRSLVNAPPMEGKFGTTGDTVHAVSEGFRSSIENTLFATAGLYVQAASRALKPFRRRVRC